MINTSARRRITVEELVDRAEIDDLNALYAYHHDVIAPRFASGQLDGTEFDLFDQIFTEDAILDFQKSGGIRADIATMKEWLAQAYAAFEMQHHVTGERQIVFSDDRREARVRTWLVNPLGRRVEDGGVALSCSGGFYLDHMVKTEAGWRIRERVYDQLWATHQLLAPSATD